MKHKRFILLALLSSFATSNVASYGAESRKPNIVVIFIDDLGYADIGPYGATKQRPQLDRMAREGIKLTSFYAAPVCSVSRAQIMTGCYGARVSVPGVYGPGGANGLHPQENTIADLLKKEGYATMCIGKWHLGDQPEFLPTNQGFDHYFGIPYSNDMQKVAKETGQRVVPLLRDAAVAELLSDEAQSRIVERYTEEAVKFIRDHWEQPFFLYLPHTAVHTPIYPGEAFRGKSANGRFGDWVEEVDWSVGRVLDTLRELKLDQNSLVIFTSDNGPWLIKGPDGGSALPLRGGKGSTWEGGVRVPTIAWWPGRIKPGTECDAVAGTIDLLPTIVNLAGGKVPAEPVIDGRDISGLMFGTSAESPREAHYYFAGYNLQAVRQGPWKLAIASQPETLGKGAASDALGSGPRLYNLDQEIGEQTNVAAKHPEIVERLRALADAMNARIGGNTPTQRRAAGKVESPRTLYPTEAKGPRKQLPTDVRKRPVVWNLDNLESIGGHKVTVVGKPRVIESDQGTAIEFDGQEDGLFVAANPLAGLKQFTAEVIFRPAAGGPKEQRFLHFQPEGSEDRVLFETRLTPDGHWFLDTYLQAGEGKYTLYAEKFLHRLGPWYHAAIVVDGKTMRHYVDGKVELATDIQLAPLAAGQTSIGVRFNKVHWYQGAIRQIRITPAVLKPDAFLKP